MSATRMRIVFIGRSVTCSASHGHATVYRSLMKGLAGRGHDVLFLERDLPGQDLHRDQRFLPYGRTVLYRDLEDLKRRATRDVRDADLVVVGSLVPDGVAVGEWVMKTARGTRAFYDLDTLGTIEQLQHGVEESVSRRLVPQFDLYLSATGGPVLHRLERAFHAQRALPLYGSVDVAADDEPLDEPHAWDLGYLGSYVPERQSMLGNLLIEPARRWPKGRFVVAGGRYPESAEWPRNVERQEHVAAADHRRFYSRQRYALNVTRPERAEVGYAPSMRLFEAAAHGTPVITDWWQGLDTFFRPGAEILVAGGPIDVLAMLRDVPEQDRRAFGDAARRRVLAEHSAEHRARELEDYVRPVEAGVDDDEDEAAAS